MHRKNIFSLGSTVDPRPNLNVLRNQRICLEYVTQYKWYIQHQMQQVVPPVYNNFLKDHSSLGGYNNLEKDISWVYLSKCNDHLSKKPQFIFHIFSICILSGMDKCPEATLMIRDSIHWMANIVQVPDSPIGIECSSTMFTKSSDPPFSGWIQVPCPILSGIKFSNTLDSSRSGT